MCSSVNYEPSLYPISDAFKMTRDDTAKQNKSMQQKQYRDKEVDGFVELREAIRETTDGQETPKTRHETLAKGKHRKNWVKGESGRLTTKLAVQQIKLLHSMNLWLHQQISIIRSRTYFQMNGHVTAPSMRPFLRISSLWSDEI